MKDDVDLKLNRLLRSAAQTSEDVPTAPFGFDTRVVALCRAGGKSSNGNGLAHLLRRVAIVASAVIVIAAAAAFREFAQTRDSLNEPSANEFAIADSVIQDEFSQ
jgi:hypothetical protein